jgi:hypothetical protein
VEGAGEGVAVAPQVRAGHGCLLLAPISTQRIGPQSQASS